MEDLDADGYPTETALKCIREWPIKSRADIDALVAYVRELWMHKDYFWQDTVSDDFDNSPVTCWHMSTAGWSGNESIIEALQENFIFWAVCWYSHRRGGHYEFRPMQGWK